MKEIIFIFVLLVLIAIALYSGSGFVFINNVTKSESLIETKLVNRRKSANEKEISEVLSLIKEPIHTAPLKSILTTPGKKRGGSVRFAPSRAERVFSKKGNILREFTTKT